MSSPSLQFYDSTLTVHQHASEVCGRIAEYKAFDAVVRLPPDHPCPFLAFSPCMSSSSRQRSREWSLTCRATSTTTWSTSTSRTRPFSPRSTCRLRAAGTASWTCPTASYRFLCTRRCTPTSSSGSKRTCISSHACRSDSAQLRASAPCCSPCCKASSITAASHAWSVTSTTSSPIDTELDSAQRSLATVQRIMSDFGLVVDPDRTEGPAQRITFMGNLLDSTQQTLSLTETRLEEIRSLLSSASQALSIRLPDLLRLVGKLQFAASVVPGARPFLRRVIDLRHDRLFSVDSQHAHDASRRRHFARLRASIRVTRGFRADLLFWHTHLLASNGRQRWRTARSAPFVFATDARLDGFGFDLESLPADCSPGVNPALWPAALLPGHGYSGRYSPEDAALHATPSQMTWAELFAVFTALITYRTVLQDCCVLVRVDNADRRPRPLQTTDSLSARAQRSHEEGVRDTGPHTHPTVSRARHLQQHRVLRQRPLLPAVLFRRAPQGHHRVSLPVCHPVVRTEDVGC